MHFFSLLSLSLSRHFSFWNNFESCKSYWMPACCVRFKGFKVKIGESIRSGTQQKWNTNKKKNAAHKQANSYKTTNGLMVRWCYSLHVKLYCQKEHFMCIYVIIKIAQLVTYDDYRSMLGTETHTHTQIHRHTCYQALNNDAIEPLSWCCVYLMSSVYMRWIWFNKIFPPE